MILGGRDYGHGRLTQPMSREAASVAAVAQ